MTWLRAGGQRLDDRISGRIRDAYGDLTMQLFELSAGLLLAIAGVVLTVRANRLISLHQRVLTWPSVPGVVVRSDLREKTDGDGTSYRAELTCTYATDGRRYTTARHTEGMSFSQPEQSARTLVAAFPTGRTVEIRVNPEDVADGVLVTGKPEHMVVIRRIGLAALVAGICLAVYTLIRGP